MGSLQTAWMGEDCVGRIGEQRESTSIWGEERMEQEKISVE